MLNICIPYQDYKMRDVISLVPVCCMSIIVNRCVNGSMSMSMSMNMYMNMYMYEYKYLNGYREIDE
jgi:hypothetical protein